MNRREFLCCIGSTALAPLLGCSAFVPRISKGAGVSEGKATVKPDDFSFCGVDCTSCDVLKATVLGDEEARRRAHQAWTKTAQQHWGMQALDPAILNCRGCRTEGADIFKGCRHCPMRRCAKQRGLSSCGQCPQWQKCERLSHLLADAPEARPNLEAIARLQPHADKPRR